MPNESFNGPIDPRTHELMEAICNVLDDTFNGTDRPKRIGFVLLTYPYGAEGRCNYMSNGANRQDIVSMFKEIIARFEGMPSPAPGTPQ